MTVDKKILIVEDDKNLIQIINDKLELEKFQTLLAYDGEEGLISALQHHPDCILLDIKMPKMDGLQMLKKLREDKWGKSVPVIILSNVDSPDYVTKALKEMAVDYMIKSDWDLKDIIKKIKEQFV